MKFLENKRSLTESEKSFNKFFKPLLLEQLLAFLLGFISTWMSSQISDQVVGGMGLSGQILAIGQLFLGIVSFGGSILLVQAERPQDSQQPERARAYYEDLIFHTLFLGMGLALFCALIFFFFSKQLLALINTPDDLLDSASLHLKIIGFSLVFEAGINAFGAVFRAFEQVNIIMINAVMMNGLNLVLNALVIFTPFSLFGKGIQGLAVAALLSKIIGFTVVLVYFIMKNKPYRKALIKGRFKFEIIREILGLGVPSAFGNICYTITQTVLTSIVGSFGSAMVTARIYAQNFSQGIFAIAASVASANQIIIGRLLGSGRKNEAQVYLIRSLRRWNPRFILLSVVIALASPLLLKMFTEDSSIISVVVKLTWLGVILEPLRAYNEQLTIGLNTVGEVKLPTGLGIITSLVLVLPGSYFTGVFMKLGLIGLWLTMIFDEGLRCFIMYRYWLRGSWKQLKISVTYEE